MSNIMFYMLLLVVVVMYGFGALLVGSDMVSFYKKVQAYKQERKSHGH